MASPDVRVDAVNTFRVSAGRFALFHVVSRSTTAWRRLVSGVAHQVDGVGDRS
jgi:hypothetical protein